MNIVSFLCRLNFFVCPFDVGTECHPPPTTIFSLLCRLNFLACPMPNKDKLERSTNTYISSPGSQSNQLGNKWQPHPDPTLLCTPKLNSSLSMPSSNHAASVTKGPQNGTGKHNIFISGTFFVILVIFCVLSISWGALWKAPARNLPG